MYKSGCWKKDVPCSGTWHTIGLPCQQAKVAIYHPDLAEVNINLGLVSRMG
jgi:hypothetical protein